MYPAEPFLMSDNNQPEPLLISDNNHPEPDQEVEFIEDPTNKKYMCLLCKKLFPIRLMFKVHNCPNQNVCLRVDGGQSPNVALSGPSMEMWVNCITASDPVKETDPISLDDSLEESPVTSPEPHDPVIPETLHYNEEAEKNSQNEDEQTEKSLQCKDGPNIPSSSASFYNRAICVIKNVTHCSDEYINSNQDITDGALEVTECNQNQDALNTGDESDSNVHSHEQNLDTVEVACVEVTGCNQNQDALNTGDKSDSNVHSHEQNLDTVEVACVEATGCNQNQDALNTGDESDSNVHSHEQNLDTVEVACVEQSAIPLGVDSDNYTDNELVHCFICDKAYPDEDLLWAHSNEVHSLNQVRLVEKDTTSQTQIINQEQFSSSSNDTNRQSVTLSHEQAPIIQQAEQRDEDEIMMAHDIDIDLINALEETTVPILDIRELKKVRSTSDKIQVSETAIQKDAECDEIIMPKFNDILKSSCTTCNRTFRNRKVYKLHTKACKASSRLTLVTPTEQRRVTIYPEYLLGQTNISKSQKKAPKRSSNQLQAKSDKSIKYSMGTRDEKCGLARSDVNKECSFDVEETLKANYVFRTHNKSNSKSIKVLDTQVYSDDPHLCQDPTSPKEENLGIQNSSNYKPKYQNRINSESNKILDIKVYIEHEPKPDEIDLANFKTQEPPNSKSSNDTRVNHGDNPYFTHCKQKQKRQEKDLGDMSYEDFHNFLLNGDSEQEKPPSDQPDSDESTKSAGSNFYVKDSGMNTMKNNIFVRSTSRGSMDNDPGQCMNGPTSIGPNAYNNSHDTQPDIYHTDYHKVLESNEPDLFSKSQQKLNKGVKKGNGGNKPMKISDHYRVWDMALYCDMMKTVFSVRVDIDKPIANGVIYIRPDADDPRSDNSKHDLSESNAKAHTTNEQYEDDIQRLANTESQDDTHSGPTRDIHSIIQSHESRDSANIKPDFKTGSRQNVPYGLAEFERDWEHSFESNDKTSPVKQQHFKEISESKRHYLKNKKPKHRSNSLLAKYPHTPIPVVDEVKGGGGFEVYDFQVNWNRNVETNEPSLNDDTGSKPCDVFQSNINKSQFISSKKQDLFEILGFERDVDVCDETATTVTHCVPKFPQPISSVSIKKERMDSQDYSNSNSSTEPKHDDVTRIIKDEPYDMAERTDTLLAPVMCMQLHPASLRVKTSPHSPAATAPRRRGRKRGQRHAARLLFHPEQRRRRLLNVATGQRPCRGRGRLPASGTRPSAVRMRMTRLQRQQLHQLALQAAVVTLVRCDAPSFTITTPASTPPAAHPHHASAARHRPRVTRRTIRKLYEGYIARKRRRHPTCGTHSSDGAAPVAVTAPAQPEWRCGVCAQTFTCRLQCDTHQRRHRHECVCRNTFNNKQDLIEHSMQHRRDLLAILGITDPYPTDACSDQADAQMSPLKKRRGSTAPAAQMAPLPTHVSFKFVWQPPEYVDKYLDRTTERI